MGSLQFLFRLLFQGRLEALAWVGRRYPETGRIRIGARRGLLLNTPELIEEVLVHRTDEFQKSPALRIYSRPLLGNGSPAKAGSIALLAASSLPRLPTSACPVMPT